MNIVQTLFGGCHTPHFGYPPYQDVIQISYRSHLDFDAAIAHVKPVMLQAVLCGSVQSVRPTHNVI